MTLNVKQAALRANVSESLVYAWIREKRIAHFRVGRSGKRGQIRIETDDLDAFVKTLRQEVAAR